MNNESFLQISYLVALIGSLLLGFLTFLSLRRSFARLCELTPLTSFAPVVRRFFLIGVLCPPVLGFCSVSYFSCSKGSYADIIQSRAYLIEVNQDQIQAALNYTVVAIVFWCLIVLGLVLTSGRART